MTHKLGENIPMEDKKSNLGALFLNDKRGNEKAPDYRGQLTTQSYKFSIAAWKDSIGSNYANAGRGILFKNTNKNSEKHPDMVGSITTNSGLRIFISAWHRESLNGNKYLRLAIKDWDNQFDQIGDEAMSLACQTWKEK